MSVEERGKLATRIQSLNNAESEGVIATFGLWIALGLLLALVAYAALSFIQMTVSLGITVPDALFDIAFYAVVSAIALLVVWGVVTGIRDLFRGRYARAKIISNIHADLKLGAVLVREFRITDYFTLFDKRREGLAYVLRCGDDEVIFFRDLATFWIPMDKEESGPPDNWDPRPDAKPPHARLKTVRAPKSDILLSFEWQGKMLPVPDPLIVCDVADWPISHLPFNEPVIEPVDEDWAASRRRYGVGQA